MEEEFICNKVYKIIVICNTEPITTRVETTLDLWLSKNPEAQEMISLIDLSNELFYSPTLNGDEGIYTIFKNLNYHLLSVLDGGDSYSAFYQQNNSKYDCDMSMDK